MGLAAWLIANGINDPAKQQGTGLLGTPRVEVKFVGSGFLQEHFTMVQATKTKWLDEFRGTTYLKVVTKRKDASDLDHAQFVGLCRWLMQDTEAISAKLKFHSVGRLLENSTSLSFSQDDIHDVTIMAWETWLFIRPENFPQT